MPGHPLADQGGEAAVPAGKDGGQVGAVVATQAGDQEGAEGALDLVPEATQQHVGVAGLDAHGLAGTVKLHHAVAFRVLHVIREDGGSILLRCNSLELVG